MIQNHSSRQNGFTIVELMIAMMFIAFLLLAIAGTVMQVGAIYNKGITMKSVNQAGRVVIADIKKTIGESQPLDVVYKPHTREQGVYDGGRLCTGSYSYIWNIGVFVDQDNPESQANRYADEANSSKPLRLVKVRDTTSRYCKENADQPIEMIGAVELLSGGGAETGETRTTTGNLAVQGFRIERTTNNLSTGRALYNITIVISDADSEAIDTVDNSCLPPADLASNQEYCAVNQFIFTAQAGNGGGE